MNPQQNEQQPNVEQPQFTQPTPVQPQAAPIQTKSHKKLALLLLIGPSALLVIGIILYTISNFIFSAVGPQPTADNLFPDNPARTIINTLLFLVSTVSILTWLPGIIIGIILLNKK